MDAPPLASLVSPTAPLSEAWQRRGRGLAAATGLLMLLLASVILMRRLAGALRQPLDAPALLVAGVIVAVSVSLLRVIWARTDRDTSRLGSAVWGWLIPAAGILLLATSLSLPGTAYNALLPFWTLIVAEEAFWLFHYLRRLNGPLLRRPVWGPPRRSVRAASDSGGSGRGQTAAKRTDSHVAPADDLCRMLPDSLPPDVADFIARARARPSGTPAGVLLAGLLRGDFVPGERNQTLHVTFCPPLDEVPRLSAVQLEGPRARIRPVEVQPYGARIDLRLSAVSEQPQSIVLRFEVHPAARDEDGPSA